MSRFDRFKPRSIHEEIREERETCQRCGGRGKKLVYSQSLQGRTFIICPTCNGTGRVESGEEHDE